MNAQRKGIPLAIALAFERNRGSASPFAPYLRLLPEGVPSLWMQSEQEVANFMSIIGLSLPLRASCLAHTLKEIADHHAIHIMRSAI